MFSTRLISPFCEDKANTSRPHPFISLPRLCKVPAEPDMRMRRIHTMVCFTCADWGGKTNKWDISWSGFVKVKGKGVFFFFLSLHDMAWCCCYRIVPCTSSRSTWSIDGTINKSSVAKSLSRSPLGLSWEAKLYFVVIIKTVLFRRMHTFQYVWVDH